MMVKAEDDRRKLRQRENELQAYNTAVCTIAMLGAALAGERAPGFEELFSIDRAPMTDEQMAAQIYALNAAFGGTDPTNKG